MSIQGSVGHLALILALLPGCGDSASSADCDPDPPCEVSGTVEIDISLASALGGGTYEVAVEADEGSAAFACTVTPADAVPTCMQTDRVGLEGWTVDITVSGTPDAPRALVLEIDRGEDDTPGPHSLTLQVRSPNGFRSTSLGRSRHVVAANGQTCEECWYELPESFGP